MNEHVSEDPLERLIARLDESLNVETSELIAMPTGDPLDRLDVLIMAAHDLASDRNGVTSEGVLGELLERIESARVIEPFDGIGLREPDRVEPRAMIAGWIDDECAALGSMPTIVRIRDVDVAGSAGKTERQDSDKSVEAAVGRVVLSMVGEKSLSATSRKKAVELLAGALERPSGDVLQAVLRILIADE